MCVHSIPTAPILVNEEPLEFVEVLTYLGSLISKDSGASKYIKARLGKAQGAFRQLRPIWRSKQYSLKTKILLFKSNVKFYLLHGSESWRVVKTDMRRMEVFHNGCLRRIRQIFWPNEKKNGKPEHHQGDYA